MIVVVRSIIEPIWAGPSLRTIFMDKNIVGYCGYSDLISFVAYRPDNAAAVHAVTASPRTWWSGAKMAVLTLRPDYVITNSRRQTRR